jgi:hypothetical protein
MMSTEATTSTTPTETQTRSTFLQPNAAPVVPQPVDGARDDLGRPTGEPVRGFSAAHEITRDGLNPSGDEARALAEAEGELRGAWGARYDEKVSASLHAANELNRLSSGEVNRFLNETGMGDSAAGFFFFEALSNALANGLQPYITDARSAARYMDAMLDGKLSETLRGAGLADDPRVARVFDHVASLLRQGGSATNPAVARRQLDAILSNRDHAYWKNDDRQAHEAAVREVNALYARLHG